MVAVPEASNFSVTPNVGGGSFATPNSNAGAIAAGQQQELGQAMQRAGGAGVDIYTAQADQANEVRVSDAVNRALELRNKLTTNDQNTGYSQQTGVDALQRPSGKPLAQEYGEQLQQGVGQIADDLGNDAQKRAFAARAAAIQTDFTNAATVHESQQFKDYTASVREGQVKIASDTMALGAQNPVNDYETIRRSIAGIRGGVEGGTDPDTGQTYKGAAQLAGKSALYAKANADEMVSGALVKTIIGALEGGDPSSANAVLGRFKDQLTGNDLLAVKARLQGFNDVATAQDVVAHVRGSFAPSFMPVGNDMARLVHLVGGAESNNHDLNQDGSVVTSPKGAKGQMQVLDGTNMAPGFGVTPAKDNSLAERARVGRDYLGAMIQHFGGDVYKGLAAYNAGPGNTEAAIKQYGDQWFDHLPQETKDYVTKISGQFNAGGGVPPRPTIDEYVEKGMSYFSQTYPGANPQTRQKVQEQLQSQYARDSQSYTEASDQAVLAAKRYVVQNKIDDPSSLPPSLTMRIPADKVPEINTFIHSVNNPPETNDPATLATLRHDDILSKYDDNQFFKLKDKLTQSTWDSINQHRIDLQKGTTKDGWQSLDTHSFNTELDNRLRVMGLNPHPKPNDKDGMEKVGGLTDLLRTSVLQAQQNQGKKFAPADMKALFDNVFSKQFTSVSNVLGFTTGVQNKSVLSANYNDLSSADQQRARAILRQHGNPAPSNAQVLTQWWHEKMTGGL
jgi:hypothetical protein